MSEWWAERGGGYGDETRLRGEDCCRGIDEHEWLNRVEPRDVVSELIINVKGDFPGEPRILNTFDRATRPLTRIRVLLGKNTGRKTLKAIERVMLYHGAIPAAERHCVYCGRRGYDVNP